MHLRCPCVASLAFTVAACAGPVTNKVLPYPALNGAAPKGELTITVDPALSEAKVACAPKESELANALDDDCDGGIDGPPAHAALVAAFAYNAPAQLELVLRDMRGEAVPASEQHLGPACTNAPSFISSQAAWSSLPAGSSKLVLRHAGVCGDAGPVTVAISLATKAGVKSYLATLSPSEQLELAQLRSP